MLCAICECLYSRLKERMDLRTKAKTESIEVLNFHVAYSQATIAYINDSVSFNKAIFLIKRLSLNFRLSLTGYPS